MPATNPLPDRLYGGLFDIALGDRPAIDMARIHCAALFYDSIIVPDGFFTARGPLFRYLQRLAQNQILEDDLLIYLRRGLVVPALRKGNHISDIWFDGEDVGFTRGAYLSAPRDEGDQVFKYLMRHPMVHQSWPQQMAEARITEFGSMLSNAFSNEFFESIANIESEFSGITLRGFTKNDAIQARRLFENFGGLIEKNASREKFRRGEIEMFFAQALGWREGFSYNNLIERRSIDLSHAASNSVMETVSTIYQIYQSQQFSCNTHLYSLNDPVASAPYVDRSAWINNKLIYAKVDLLNCVDFSKINCKNILDVRDLSDENGNNLFIKAKTLRSRVSASAGSAEAIAELVEFCETEYMPRLLMLAPHARRQVVARTAASTVQFTGDASTVTGLVCLVLGEIGIFVAKPIENIVALLGAASLSFVGRALQKPTIIDRLLQSHHKKRTLDHLSREMSIFDRLHQ